MNIPAWNLQGRAVHDTQVISECDNLWSRVSGEGVVWQSDELEAKQNLSRDEVVHLTPQCELQACVFNEQLIK